MSQSDCEQNSLEEEKKPIYKFHLETIQKYKDVGWGILGYKNYPISPKNVMF